VTWRLEQYALAGDQTMSIAAKVVHCTAGFEYVKRLVTLRATGFRGIMCTTGTADNFTVAERQRLLTFFTHHHHFLLPA